MPFSSTPVIVSPGDQIELRYPTPDTWETQITFQVSVGEGVDDVNIGTKIPDATPTFSGDFLNNSAALNEDGSNQVPGVDPLFQRNTYYYSNLQTVGGIELRVPIKISVYNEGPPRPSQPIQFPNSEQCAYRINDSGPWITPSTQSVPITGTATEGSKTITGVDTTGMAVGMYVESNRIGGEIINISGNTVTVVAKAKTSGDVTGDVYFTVRQDDTIRLRILTEDWYTTNTVVTVTVSDEFWTNQTPISDSWCLTTRPQELDIDQYSLIDFVDRRATSFGDYEETSIPITGIDFDAVVEAQSTGNIDIAKTPTGPWAKIQNNYTLGDTLYIRSRIGDDYTTKLEGTLSVEAIPGKTVTIDGVDFENNILGTWGDGVCAETQTISPVVDDQQIWTEVDRYPDPINLSPIFTGADEFIGTLIGSGANYTVGVKTTTLLSGGSGADLLFNVTSVDPITGAVLDGYIEDRGSGYSDGDILRVNGGNGALEIELKQYRTVTVSSDNTISNAEPDRNYYVDIPISGLGVEYEVGDYDNLETPFEDFTSGALDPADVQASNALGTGDVQIRARIVAGTANVRKNNTGEWVDFIYVQNGDVLNLRQKSPLTFNTAAISTLVLDGPPDGGPFTGVNANPTLGPTAPTFPELNETITVQTRAPRVVPYRVRATPVFDAPPGATITATIEVDGLDANTTITRVDQSPFAVGQVRGSGSFGLNDTIVAANQPVQAAVRLTASLIGGETRFVTYRIGTTTDYIEDTFVVVTKKEDYIYQVFNNDNPSYILPDWVEEFDIYMVGAGGGKGGNDLPASDGGVGAPGNIIASYATIPTSEWVDPFVRQISIFSGNAGQDGENFIIGALGGSGGDGFVAGGDGGTGSGTENSGGGGGGGGATAVIKVDTNTILGVAGGGGGGGGAGSDTFPPTIDQQGNRGLTPIGGGVQTLPASDGTDGQTNAIQGGGAGGGGGGWGIGGLTNTQLEDPEAPGIIIGTTDLDAQGGSGGGWYLDPYLTEFPLGPNQYLSNGEGGAGPGQDGFVVIGYPPQDTLPDPFAFTSVTSDISTATDSEIVQITGITGSVTVTVTGTGVGVGVRAGDDPVSILSEPFTVGTNIFNEQYLQIRLTTGLQYQTTYVAQVTVGTGSPVNWLVSVGEPPDTIPTNITFPDVIDAELSTLVESEPQTVGGINVPVGVLLDTNAEIRVGVEDPANPGTYIYGAWNTGLGLGGAATVTVENGNKIQLRILSSADNLTEVTAVVQVGSGSQITWNVTTKPLADTTPNTLIFLTKVNVDLNSQVFSNYQLIEDIDEPINIEVLPDPTTGINAFFEVNGIQTGFSSLQVQEFDEIRLYFTTNDEPGQPFLFEVIAGSLSPNPTWTVVNTGEFGTTPDTFTFGTESTPIPNVDVESGTNTTSFVVTVSGLINPAGIFATPSTGSNPIFLNIDFNDGNGFTGFQTYDFADVGSNTVFNGAIIQARLKSPAFPGFSALGEVFIGGGSGTYTVITEAPVGDPILGQWYSSLNVSRELSEGSNTYARFATKFDGLPVGSMMPAFKDSVNADSSSFGELDGSPLSRFPGFIYCDGQYVDPEDYPLLYAVLGITYGSQAVVGEVFSSTLYDYNGEVLNNAGDGKIRFRLPDFRNKKIVGTGRVDGNISGSPSLTPDYGPAKTAANASVNQPGSHGGLWFIDDLGVSSAQNIPQVEEPGVGELQIQSDFFSIGNISTEGYENIGGLVDFVTTGEVTGKISLEETRLFDIPFHTHELITGRAGFATTGRVFWNQPGGRSNADPLDGADPTKSSFDANVNINLWGFPVSNNIPLDKDNTVESLNNSTSGFFTGDTRWFRQTFEYSGATDPVGSGSQYDGVTADDDEDGVWDEVEWLAVGLNGQSGDGYDEINEYINIDTLPFGGISQGNLYKYIAALDIPVGFTTIDQYKPVERLNHTHYLTFGTPENVDGDPNYSYGNFDGTGTVRFAGFEDPDAPSNPEIDLTFSVLDVGIEVIPGEFTLGSGKQLIPEPSLAPQDQVGLITPYVWTKWMIKAF